MAIDLRKSINYISDVVANRPSPIREFDQIYMKHADMLLQAEHVSKWFDGKDVVFIGDGDGISLCIAHLQNHGQLQFSTKSILVLDFDERIVNAINNFALKNGIDNLIQARLYNVANPLPKEYWQKFQAFYTNPPYGASNHGSSIRAFMKRGFEATGENAIGCIVMADYDELPWTKEVLYKTQKMALACKFMVAEMLPTFHYYHLDDVPELTSCSLILKRFQYKKMDYCSEPLAEKELKNFYGQNNPLRIEYVKDLTNAGKYASRDYELVAREEIEKCQISI